MLSEAYMLSEPKQKALEAAISRRFGRSIMPYRFECETEMFSDVWRCTDTESGHYIVARVAGRRIRVIREYDAEHA